MDSGPSAESTDSSELSTALARLGLSQYEERLRENGFDEWETLIAITETDMIELGFRLGDRRKLQRALRDCSSASAVPAKAGIEILPGISEGLPGTGESSEVTPQSLQQVTRTTRPYRRHPRPDVNAPHKPKTAYVRFGENVRRDPAFSHLSFVEIAKETGKRWRDLPSEERANIWEKPAADRLKEYKRKLEDYKETEEYQSYQTYLEVFEQRRHIAESTTSSDNKVPSTSEPASSGQLLAWHGQEDLEAVLHESVDTEDLDLEGESQETASPVKSGMKEARHILKALGVNSHLLRIAPFPPEDMTNRAVKAFSHGTGSLLYLWSQTDILNLVRSVYHPQSNSKPVYTTEVFAMSAVGSYCDGDIHTTVLQEKF